MTHKFETVIRKLVDAGIDLKIDSSKSLVFVDVFIGEKRIGYMTFDEGILVDSYTQIDNRLLKLLKSLKIRPKGGFCDELDSFRI